MLRATKKYFAALSLTTTTFERISELARLVFFFLRVNCKGNKDVWKESPTDLPTLLRLTIFLLRLNPVTRIPEVTGDR